VAGWDSFNFIVEAEAGFGVRFRIAGVESLPDAGAIVTASAAAHGR
jgi:hypothetical protein